MILLDRISRHNILSRLILLCRLNQQNHSAENILLTQSAQQNDSAKNILQNDSVEQNHSALILPKKYQPEKLRLIYREHIYKSQLKLIYMVLYI
jgi:hypothetical protein